jgi:two-component system NtrC family sensor kinase
MKLRARLVIVSLGALLVPVLVAIGVAAAVVVESSGRSQELRLSNALKLIQKDIRDTEQHCLGSIERLARSDRLLGKLYVYNKYWGHIGKDTLDGDIAVLRDDLEGHLLSEAIDTIAVYRREGERYAAVVVVGNSTYVRDTIDPDVPARLDGRAEYAQNSDGIYASLYRPLYREGELIGLIVLQKAFNRGYLETLSLRHSVGVALYAQGLYRYTSLPGIETAGVLWPRAQSMTDGPFSGTYTHQGKRYRYIGSYIQMSPTARGFLFVGGASESPPVAWWAEFTRLSVVALVCVAVATVLFTLWGSKVIGAIRILLGAFVHVGRGQYDVRLPVRRHDEFGELYRGFTRMAGQLEENAARLEESKRRLVTSERMAALGRFSAGVAHEINNPMGILLNHVQLLRSGRLDEGEKGGFLERIETEIKRVSRLLTGFLHHATDEEQAFSDLPLEAVVTEVVQLFTPKLRLRGARVEVLPFPPGTTVEGDADALKQVFFNLLHNAIQAIGHDHGLIRIDAHADPDGYRVRVTDNGVGMDEGTKAAIFQPFVTRKRGYGTGLGLALSQTIMKRHGGTIEAGGEPGLGTTVTLWFPRREDAC